MTRDAHVEEHDNFDDAYLSDALVILDGRNVRVIPELCPECGRSDCHCDFEQPDRWLRRHRTGERKVNR